MKYRFLNNKFCQDSKPIISYNFYIVNKGLLHKNG